MNDRELLELAAKAAGLPHQWCDAWNTMAKILPDGGFVFSEVWNPLIDDGDALRLAVRLQMAVSVCTDYTVMLGCETRENHRTDPYAATRRAIVRAAAEIGRGME